MLYLADVVPDHHAARVREIITNPPDGFVRVGSPWMVFFLLEAFVKMGD
jgi:hypothetical protein